MVSFRRIRWLAAFAVAVGVTLPGGLDAQYLGGGTKSFAEVQVADLEAMRDKFVGLAEAIPTERYGWRPMEGVRSVRDVLHLIAAEGTLFPTQWDYEAPAWVAEGGFGPELARLREVPDADLAEEIARSFDNVIGLARDASEEERAREVNFFGLTVPLEAAFTLMANDMHEHLGQLIAYARANEVVPPWSQ